MTAAQSALDEVLAMAASNGRVCPQPQLWNRLYGLLPNKRQTDHGWEPPLPLILAAWYETPALSKIARLREHIEWADQHGALEIVCDYLASLPETQWHHLGEGGY